MAQHLGNGRVVCLQQAIAQRRDMPSHGPLGSGRITTCEIRQNLAMLRHRLVLTAGDEKDTKLMPNEWCPQHTEELVDEFVSCHLDNALVETANQR